MIRTENILAKLVLAAHHICMASGELPGDPCKSNNKLYLEHLRMAQNSLEEALDKVVNAINGVDVYKISEDTQVFQSL